MEHHRILTSIAAGLSFTLLFCLPVFAGLLSFQGWAIEQDGADETIYNECNDLTLSPDNQFAYTPHYNRKIMVFKRDAATGKFRFTQSLMDRVDQVECFSSVFAVRMSSDAGHLYTVSLHDNALSLFNRDRQSGKLTFVECYQEGQAGVNGIISPWSLTLSPDDRFVYVAGYDSHAVAVFSRNMLTGWLAFVESQTKDLNGVEGLGGITSLTITPDNKNLYAVGSRDSTLTVFKRDLQTGKLFPVETQKNGIGGVDGLGGVQCIIVNRDGKHLYAAGFLDHAIAVFNRDPATGKLTFLEMQKNGMHGVKGIAGVMALAFNPNGKYLYAVSQGDHALTIFSCEEQTGRLRFAEMHQSGTGGAYGFLTPQQVTVSADGKHIYIINRSKSGEKPVLFSAP